MKIFSEVIGNMTTDPQWAEKLKNTKIEYLELDQWTAQKSRFIAKGSVQGHNWLLPEFYCHE